MKQKYPNGTILKPTAKALRLHPNHFSPEDRFRVTGPASALWFKTTEWTDPFSKRRYKAGETIMAGDDDTGEIRRTQDSFVEEAK
jgi:rRNA maturation protein Nop10